MAGDSMFGSPLGIRKFAKEQPREKIADRVFPPSPTLAQLNDLSMSGFDPVRDLPAIIATARMVQEPTIAAPPAAEPLAGGAAEPAPRVARQLNIPAVVMSAPESVRLWEEYNRTENPADFVRADEQMMRERATAQAGGFYRFEGENTPPLKDEQFYGQTINPPRNVYDPHEMALAEISGLRLPQYPEPYLYRRDERFPVNVDPVPIISRAENTTPVDVRRALPEALHSAYKYGAEFYRDTAGAAPSAAYITSDEAPSQIEELGRVLRGKSRPGDARHRIGSAIETAIEYSPIGAISNALEGVYKKDPLGALNILGAWPGGVSAMRKTVKGKLDRAEGGQVEDYDKGGAVKKALQAVADLFSTPEMAKWRGKSVIPSGSMEDRYFHGTSKDKDFAKFNVGRHGVWLTKDPAEASQYALENDSMGFRLAPGGGWNMEKTNDASRVIPVFARAENPHTGPLPDFAMAPNYKRAQSDWFDQLRSQGYDAWLPETNPNLAVILRDPEQIKSAITNTGEFSGPRIDRDKGGAVKRAMRSGFDQGGAAENEPGLVDRALSFLSQLNPVGSAEASPVKALVRGAKNVAPETMRGTTLVTKDPAAATAILSKRDPSGAVDFGQGINQAEYTFTRKGDLQPWKEFDPYQAVKERGIIAGLLGDRSAAGSIVHDINSVKLTEPVNRFGGGEFQRSLEGPEVWASRPSAVKNIYTRINKGMKELSAPMDTPLFASHVVMGTPSIDSTQNMAKAILRQIEPTRSQIDPKVAKAFDVAIRKAYPDWPGILSPVDAERFLATKEVGKRTSRILQQLDTAKAQKGGLPNLGAARFAMMEPRLVSADQGATGFAISRLDPNRVTNVAVHDTYPRGMLGPSQSAADYMGGTKYQIPLNVMFPDWWKTIKPTYVEKKTGLIKATSPTMIQQNVLTQVPLQRANQEWLDNLMKYIEENPKKWGYRLGGAAKQKTKKSVKVSEAA